jgi:hypothetical protein
MFREPLETALTHSLKHLDALDDCPIGPRAGLSTLRARLDRPLENGGTDPSRVIDDLAADIEGGLNVSASGRFQVDEARARDDRQGLWKGCFAAPREFRAGKKDGPLLGAACRTDRDREIREALFPEDLVMPASCNIKGKYAVRARVTGNLGIYHLQGCRSYPGLTKPDRWFCSEEDAQAAGFRRAYNCRSTTKSK